jgi:hypothetical protein
VAQWFPWYETLSTARAIHKTHREFFAIDYTVKYLPASSQTLLILDHDTKIDLNKYWSDPSNHNPNTNNRGAHPVSASQPSYVSSPISIRAKLGDRDGINPPWFHQTDAALLYWDIHHDTALIPIRFKVYDYQIEVWPDSDQWDKDGSASLLVKKPLITVYNPDGDRGMNMQVRLPYDDDTENTSPSRTLPLRRGIQRILVPTGLYVWNHSGFVAVGLFMVYEIFDLAFKGLVVYAMVVVACWIGNGRPLFGPWAQRH